MHVLYARDRLPLSGLERGLYRLAGIDPKAEQSWIGWSNSTSPQLNAKHDEAR